MNKTFSAFKELIVHRGLLPNWCRKRRNRNRAGRHAPPPASCKVRLLQGPPSTWELWAGDSSLAWSLSTFPHHLQVEFAPLSASSGSSGSSSFSDRCSSFSAVPSSYHNQSHFGLCVHKPICLSSALQMIIVHTEAVLTRACALTILIIPISLRFYY